MSLGSVCTLRRAGGYSRRCRELEKGFAENDNLRGPELR